MGRISKDSQIKPLPCPQCHHINLTIDCAIVPEWETEYQGEVFRAGWHKDISVKCGDCGWTPTNFGYKPWGDDAQKIVEWWNSEVRKLPLY